MATDAPSPFTSAKACVFDAYGTLFDVHSAIRRGGEELGEKAEIVSELWRQKQLEYTWLRSLMSAHVDFWQVTSDSLDFALSASGTNNAALHRKLMELYLTLDAYPEVKETLKKLKMAGLTTAILSNGNPGMLEAAVTSAGLDAVLDQVLSVEDVGIYKPDARVYQLAVDRLAIPKAMICFLSSNGWDARGAAHFGFTVAWINRFNREPDRIPGDIKATIRRLDELPPLLGLK
ncbi:haloacid dehalogenase type II [Pelagibius litoralis]|uniref:(S)-2-haloacid dehalogenase n=1 Tax=Pelagibius litoralis TaxID=374515 RepID=A0A967C4C5_9PROT|nr:haloacid dehalogenase type II [Pelagibius litoralis]NIA66986.1 haloacid dehalogenase type II [Pelagibius litoralis]